MKFVKQLLLLALTSSLFLVGCAEESGFSISKSVPDETQQSSTMGDDLRGDQKTDDNSNSGATGPGDNKDDNVEIKEDETTGGNGQSTGLEETTAIDLGNQVINFTFNFIKSDEENYVIVSYEEDPFDSKYDFSYYTVNDAKLDKPEYRHKEIIDNVETYKIYLGSNESGTYVIKFYNSEGKQYGRVNVAVKFKETQQNPLYISVAFNLVKVRFISISFTIQNVFKKIGNFFSNLFNADRISL